MTPFCAGQIAGVGLPSTLAVMLQQFHGPLGPRDRHAPWGRGGLQGLASGVQDEGSKLLRTSGEPLDVKLPVL